MRSPNRFSTTVAIAVRSSVRYAWAIISLCVALLVCAGCEADGSAEASTRSAPGPSPVDARVRLDEWSEVKRVFTPLAAAAIRDFDLSIKPLEDYLLSPEYKVYGVSLGEERGRCVFTITLAAHVYADLDFKYRGYVVDRSLHVPVYVAFYQRGNDRCARSFILQAELLEGYSVDALPVFADSTLALDDNGPFEGPIRGYHVVSKDSMSMIFDAPSH